MKRTGMIAGSLVALLLGSSSAFACPFCDTETGREVQAGIFNDLFWSNVLLALLPFVILLTVVALIYFDAAWPWTRNKARHEAVVSSPAHPAGD